MAKPAKQTAKQIGNDDKTSNERGKGGPGSGAAAPGTTPEGNAEEDYLYGLASVLYHALQGVSAARKYKEDARRAGVEELVEFFEEAQTEATARAKQAKSLLVSYSEEEDDEDEGDEEDEDDEDEDDET